MKLATAEKSILFMNNIAGDDLWEYGHLLVEDCPKFSTPHELCVYKSASRYKYDSQGLYMTLIPYTMGKNESIQIYGFPFLSFDVDPSDIEYPTPISGIVVTQDMRMLDFFLEEDPDFHHVAKSQTSRLAWAQEQSTPVVLAVHHVNGRRNNMEDLNRLVGMYVSCPVLWHSGKPNEAFFHKTIQLLLSRS